MCSRYVLEERLEHGRLGVVYRAYDRQGPARVALLVLPGEIAANERMLGAVREDFARLRALDHPNIVEVLDLANDGNTWFFTLELVEGESLESVLENVRPQKLNTRDAYTVIRSVGAALEHAHDCGVAHGDVRPENVIVSGRREVKLLFASTCLLRSPPFSVDARDDVFGLGCLAYELLQGQPPAGGYHAPSSVERAQPPARIKGLSRRQWSALRGALAPRDRRARNVGALLMALGVARVRPRRERGPGLPVAASSGRMSRALAVLLVLGLAGAAAHLNRDRIEQWSGAAPARLEQALEPVEQALEPVAGLIRRGQSALAARLEASAERAAESWPPGDSAGTEPLPAAPAAAETDAVETAATASAATEPAATEAPVAETPATEPPAAATDESAAAIAAAEAPPPAATPSEPPGRAAAEPPEPAAPSPRPAAAGATAERARSAMSAAPARAAASAGETGRAAFARRESVVSESAGAVAVEIRRNDASGPLTVAWWTSDGTAVAGEDYANFGAVIETFAPGESRRTVYVPITADTLPEETETFYVYLRGGPETGRATDDVTRMTVTIIDDD